MARFTTTEAKEIRAIRTACHSGLNSTELLASVNQRLQSAIGLDAYCSNLIDPATMLITSAVAEGWPYEAKVLLIDHVLLQSHVADPSKLFMLGRRSVDVDDIVSELDKPLDDAYFQFHLLPFGFRHEAILLCSFKGTPQVLMTLTRSEASGQFAERQYNLLNALAPHISTGLAKAAVRETLESPQGSDVGFIVLDDSGGIELANTVADEWLTADSRKHWPLALPLILSLVSRRLGRSEFFTESMSLETTHPQTGALYRIHGERQISTDGLSRTVILMEPLRLAESPESLRRMGLTSREAEVALALVRGLTVKEISFEFRRSPHTVTQHIKHIFTKLGVSSRNELAFLLMSKSSSANKISLS